MSSRVHRIAIPLLTMLLVGCGFVHDQKIDGPYRLIAVDLMKDMSVSYSLGDGNAVGRIEETVFAVGFNKDFIVAKQHPNGDRKITHCYFLTRAKDHGAANPSDCVSGPFTEQEFLKERLRLGLPDFTIEFPSLK